MKIEVSITLKDKGLSRDVVEEIAEDFMGALNQGYLNHFFDYGDSDGEVVATARVVKA